MSNKTYKNSIIGLSVTGVIVLILGIVLSVIPLINSSPEAPVSSQEAVLNKNEALPPLITTSEAESYVSLAKNMDKLKNRFPKLLSLYSIGTSEAGRQQLMFSLGNGEKKALIVGAIHAREHITTKYLLKVVEDYCIAYTTTGFHGEYNIKNLLDTYTLYIIPCVNPDGLEIIFSRDKAEDFVKISKLSEYKANKNGVDLNRNFPIAWESINNNVTAPADFYFKGYESGDAKETKNLINLCEENEFDFLISVHIKGNCIFWGDTYNTALNSVYEAFAKDIGNATGLVPASSPTEKPKDYGGGFENWFRHTYNRPGICIELSENENKILPCGNENYTDFYSFVNYSQTSNAIAAAMMSGNK
ncbi:MAG: hypothetical protein IJO44_08815 [Clostridia bacterium]|nr:hypothetical protein [Clostridia bacterium]